MTKTRQTWRSAGAVALAAALLTPGAAFAASISTTLDYSKSNVGLNGGGALSFDKTSKVDLGIAQLAFGAKASSGDVDAAGSIGFTTSFGDTVQLSNANNVQVDFSLDSLNFGYNTFMGARAGASIDFYSFQGINLAPIDVIDKGYSLSTADSRTGSFGSTGNDRGTQRLTGVGPDISLGLGIRAVANLDASQTSTFSVSDLTGTLIATHSSGLQVMDAFSLVSDSISNLDLSVAGQWTLELVGVDLKNMFDTALGLSGSYEAGLAFGEVRGGCGDYSKDSDNVNSITTLQACVADVGKSGSTPQLTLIDPAAFAIAWGTKSVSLGTIDVLGPNVSQVPLPAGVPLLLTGIAGFAALRRRQKR